MSGYWYPFIPRGQPTNSTWIDPMSKTYLCYKDEDPVMVGKGPLDTCTRWNAAALNRFTEGLRRCFKRAVDVGFETLVILPHMDYGLPPPHSADCRDMPWRNYLVLDPKWGPGGYSYQTTMLQPLANALNMAVKPTTNVWFAYSGEMGAATFQGVGPKLIPTMLEDVRRRIPRAKSVRIGITFNHNSVYGIQAKNGVFNLANVNKEAVKKMMDFVDFYGLSEYAPKPDNPGVRDMAQAAVTSAQELALLGIDLLKLTTTKGKVLLYNELGMGGGGNSCGDKLAPNAAYMWHHPWSEMKFPNAPSPWANPKLKACTRLYFKLVLQFMRYGAGGVQWRVDGGFAWTMGTLDFLGMSVYMSQGLGHHDRNKYNDITIANMIRDHNRALRGLPALG